MLKTAPKPIDVQDLQFKLRCRIKVFDNVDNSNFPRHCSLIACASRFGLIFVGTNTSSIQVIQLKNLDEYTKNDRDKADYPRRTLPLPSAPMHLSVNCEHTLLAIVIEKNGCPCALFYDVKSFWQQELIQIGEIRLSPTPGVQVTEVNWNPAVSSIFTACKNDGTLGIYEIKNPGIDINELPAASGASCFCWSPKGKQIAVGSRDGKITQYKPDLKAVKVVNAPPLKETSTLLSLQWVSNYQFIGVFQPLNPDGQTNFIVIDSPKTGECTYTSYDDICYSNGNTRPMQFYLILLHNWNILMAASSNSMEVGILGNTGDCWTQWIMGDAARAELPLSSSRQDTLPIGCAVDIGSTQPLPWGESTLPPTPFLLLLSHHGTLCCFNVVNLKDGIPSICTPPDPIKDLTGLQYFVIDAVGSKPNKENQPRETNIINIPKIPQALTNVEKPMNMNNVSSATSVFRTQPTPSVPSTGLNFPQNQPVNLFGGQATLTPVQTSKPTTQPSLMPKYQSLFPAATTSESNVAISPILPTSTPVPTTVATKPVVLSIPVTTTPKIVPESNENLNKNDVNLKAEEEAEKIFAQMVKEECIFLESELKAVLHQGRTLKLNLGSDADKTEIVESTKLLEDFFNEVVDICTTQNAEVHILKQNLLQSWAWYEEVKSRHLASKDQSMMILIRAQPLDSASEKQLADIRHANYYLESQVAQAHHALDEQWESFQDYCKKTHKIQIPTMEMIFQTMVKQNAILKKQSYVLKDIASRIKSKSRSMYSPSLLLSIADNKDLPAELMKLRMDPEDICQIHYERVMNRMKCFTQKKSDVLRSFLKKREYSHVSVVKPQLSSSIIQTSPPSKLKQLSLAAMKTPPKDHRPKKLDFMQPTLKPPMENSEAPNTPIEGLQSFTLKFEAKNFANLAEKSFTPLTKSVISGSPNSAFVSTFGNNTPVSTSSFKPTFLGASPNTATPSYVVVTTTAEKNQPVITVSSKPFSFVGSTPATQVNAPGVSKPSANLFSNAATKPLFSFNFQNVTTAAPTLFETTNEMKNLQHTSNANVTAKPLGTVLTSSTSDIQSATVGSTTKVSSTLSFPASASGTTASVGPFSVPGSTGITNIFASTNQTSVTNVATKPFAFPPKTTALSTKPSVAVTAVTKPNAAVSQPFSFAISTTATTTETGKAPTQPSSAVAAPKVTTQAASTVSSSTPSVGAVISTTTAQSSVATSVPALSTSGLKLTVVSTSSVPQPAATTTEPASVTSSTSSSKVVTTAGSIFNTPNAASQQSIFGSVSTSNPPSSGPIFDNTPSSKPLDFAGSEAKPASTVSFGTSAAQPSIFGRAVSSTTAPSSTSFGTAVVTAAQTSLFGGAAASSAPSVFGNTSIASSAPSVFGNTSIASSTPSVFGNASTASATPSVFGSAAAPPARSVFGPPAAPFSTPFQFGNAATPSSAPSVFGNAPAASSTSPVFESAATTTAAPAFGTTSVSTTQSTIFGNSSPATTTPSLFGAVTPTTSVQTVFGSSNQASVFGSAAPSTTPQSIFGTAPASTIFGDGSQKSSVFGSAPSSTQSSMFGKSQPLFGNPVSSAGSAFGQTQTSNYGQQSVFGSAGSSFGATSVFGSSSPSFGQSSGSIFGGTPTTASGSIFGGSSTTSGATFGSGSSLFGTPASTAPSLFGSSNAFSSPTTQQSTFSANANSGSFGFGSLNVGSTVTTSSSGFGSAPTSNPFGGDNKSIFGNSPASPSTSLFGSNTGSAFGNSPQQTFGGNFGSPSVFGQQQSSAFGQNSFGSSTFGQQPAGPFSNGSSGSVGQTGFGAAASNFQKPAGFGSPPVFGSSPTFGSSPSFGGAPTFGNQSVMGNTSKIFGSNSSAFGATSNTQSPGFGSMANQPTFGNLAQQAANSPSSAPFSGNSSFSSWR